MVTLFISGKWRRRSRVPTAGCRWLQRMDHSAQRRHRPQCDHRRRSAEGSDPAGLPGSHRHCRLVVEDQRAPRGHRRPRPQPHLPGNPEVHFSRSGRRGGGPHRRAGPGVLWKGGEGRGGGRFAAVVSHVSTAYCGTGQRNDVRKQ